MDLLLFLCELVFWIVSGRYFAGATLIILALLFAFLLSPWMLLLAVPGVALIVWKYTDDHYWRCMGP